MNFTRLVKKVPLLLVVAVCFSNCADLFLYVSPGNFYQTGILPVEVVSIPDTTAPVEMDVYTPTWSARYPVVVFQHGFGGSIKAYETISKHLASHGFVVILPQMYGPGFQDAPTAEEEAVLGLEVLSWIEDNLNDFVPVQADTDLLGLAGHSRGGQVAYRLALKLPEQVRALAGVDPVDATEMSNDTKIVTGPLTFDIPTYILGARLGLVPVEGGMLKIPCAPEESGYSHLDKCSIVTAPYESNNEVVGVLGVIGPKRMEYDRVIPVVDVTAKLLSSALKQL